MNIDFQPIDTAPKDRAILVCVFPEGEAAEFDVAIWFFGDWGTTEGILGDGIRFKPTHWCELPLKEASE